MAKNVSEQYKEGNPQGVKNTKMGPVNSKSGVESPSTGPVGKNERESKKLPREGK